MKTLSLTATRLVLSLAAAGIVGGASVGLVSGTHATAATPVATQSAAPPVAAAGVPDFSQIAQRHGAAVVNISVIGKAGAEDGQQAQNRLPPGIDPNDPFFEFFKRFQGPGGQGGAHEAPSRGQGSGFIISAAEGLIVTNNHVVEGAECGNRIAAGARPTATGLLDAAVLDVPHRRTALRQLQANDNEARINKAIEGKAAIPYGKRNPEVMGFFLVEVNSRGGVFARAAWLMNVHPRSFIPANNPNAVLLVDALLDNGHAFQRILTDVQPMKKVAPDWLVRHVIGPNGQTVARAALDVLDRGSSPEYLQTRHAMAASLAAQGVPTWTWVPSGSWAERRVPALPPRDEQAADEVQHRLQEISTCADADYQFGSSPRFSN